MQGLTVNEPPLSPPICISPEAIDEKLQHYVSIFGTRWPLIRTHMQVQFSCSFPQRFLEKRWQEIVASRSPLTNLQEQPADAAVQERMVTTPTALQTKSPKQANSPKASPKRWREEGGVTPQPARPPPPPSPHTTAGHLPKGLSQGLCPQFLLAPGSSLAAPDNVRRQLKAVYLASLIAKGDENTAATDVAVPIEEDAVMEEAAQGEPQAAPEAAFASEAEKHQIVALLARELATFRRKPAVATEANGTEVGGDSGATDGAKKKMAGEATLATSPASRGKAVRSPKAALLGGAASPVASARSPRRWPAMR